ncbi:MAG: hypothetical protein EAZ97_01480 [Bacteroidetes bacterium]|nr:MAG: hypothetical protein EAZ97_01480 [Bacteroidota bacterium]
MRLTCWQIDLAHDFYEIAYLPENDRVRYSISESARKEILAKLLALNLSQKKESHETTYPIP